MSARSKPLKIEMAVEGVAPTKAVSFDKPVVKTAVRMIDPENVEELVRLLHEEAKAI